MIVCPTSAAAPVAPRYRRPLSTQPPPTPVPIVNMTRCGQVSRPPRTPRPARRRTRRSPRRPVGRRGRSAAAQRHVLQRDVDAERIRPVLNSTTDGTPIPTARVGPRAPSIASRAARRAPPASPARSATSCDSDSSPPSHGGGDLRAADVDADELVAHEIPRRGSVEHHEQLDRRRGARARTARSRRRLAERARDRLRLVLAGDQEDDVARRVEHRQRERDARHLRLHARPSRTPTTSRRRSSTSRLAGEQRGACGRRGRARAARGQARRRRRAPRARSAS